MQALTLSDGTLLPKRITITAPVSQIAMDLELFLDSEILDGLRFFQAARDAGKRSQVSLCRHQ